MSSRIRSAVLSNYVELARQLGLNPFNQLSEVGLSLALLADPDNRIPTDAVVQLLENSARASDCPSFGLRMAETRELSDFGALSLLLLHQQSLREALHITMHYRHLLNESLVLHIEEAGKWVIIREEIATDVSQTAHQATEYALGVLYRMCGALQGTRWRPESVNFTQAPPADLQLHKRLFPTRLQFNAEFNGIICAAADLDLPNPQADHTMARYAGDFIASLQSMESRTTTEEVRQTIYLLLPMGRASIEQIAQTMGVNARTLQRRLEEDGTTFSDLMNDVRSQLVQRYMANPHYSLSQIAGLLGYSVASSFTRWFRSQFGTTPASWRARQTSTGKGPKQAG